MDKDEAHYRRALERIEQITLVLGIGGIVVVWGAFTLRHAMSFAAGSVMAYVSFLMMKRLVQSLGASENQARSGKASAIAMALRYVIIGAVVFGIMKVSGTSPWPVFAGLMTTVAAVIAVILIELVASFSSSSTS
jgi:small-conductance mechanosensitive channel